MKIYDNGVCRDVTDEELAEFERIRAIMDEQPTESDRLDAIEAAILELAEVVSNG